MFADNSKDFILQTYSMLIRQYVMTSDLQVRGFTCILQVGENKW